MPHNRSARILSNVGEELKQNPPKAMQGKSGKKRESIRRAILLSKARRKGASV